MKKRIAEIEVGSRIREEMGDLKALADSMRTYGQIQPIVVDESGQLIAGGRRLAVAQMLGWKEIETVLLSELDEHTKRMIELEENIRRKDLTEFEKSERLTQLLKKAQEKLRADAQPEEIAGLPADREVVSSGSSEVTPRSSEAIRNDSVVVTGKEELSNTRPVLDKSVNRPGPQARPDSLRNASALTGIPQMTFVEAQQHVEVVKEIPALKDQPKTAVVQVARELRKMNDPEKREAYKTALSAHPELVQMSTKPEHVLELSESREQIELDSVRVKGILDAMGAVRRMKIESDGDVEALLAAYLHVDTSRVVVPTLIEQWRHIAYVFGQMADKLDRRSHSKLEVLKK